MELRKYNANDCKELAQLFYDTVHTINAKDYTKEQLNVWATGQIDFEKWNASLSENHTVIAVEKNVIVGFGDMDKTGYIDRLFVHKNYQGKGIATAICDELEKTFHPFYTTHASITAKPFFEKRGYVVIRKQQINRNGIFLTNFVMKKNISP